MYINAVNRLKKNPNYFKLIPPNIKVITYTFIVQ